MTCNRANAQLDEYLDGGLSGSARRELHEHVDACPDCSLVVARERELRRALAQYAVPGPSAGFFDRALEVAAHDGSQDDRHSRWGLGVGSAAAAVLTLFVIAAVFFRAPDVDQPAALAGVTLALEETRTVNLVFAAVEELPDATLTVQLPPGVELAGFGGQREIRWSTTLREGKNLLPLKLIARDDPGGVLVAHLEHADRQKIFRVDVTVL